MSTDTDKQRKKEATQDGGSKRMFGPPNVPMMPTRMPARAPMMTPVAVSGGSPLSNIGGSGFGVGRVGTGVTGMVPGSPTMGRGYGEIGRAHV